MTLDPSVADPSVLGSAPADPAPAAGSYPDSAAGLCFADLAADSYPDSVAGLASVGLCFADLDSSDLAAYLAGSVAVVTSGGRPTSYTLCPLPQD